MRKDLSPRETIIAGLAAVFLLGFVVLFVWLLMLSWTARGRLPRFTESDVFTQVTTTIVGLVGGIAATRLGQRDGTYRGLQQTFGWVYVAVYFVLGLAALITTLVVTVNGKASLVPEAVRNLGMVSFGLAVAAVGAYLGSEGGG